MTAPAVRSRPPGAGRRPVFRLLASLALLTTLLLVVPFDEFRRAISGVAPGAWLLALLAYLALHLVGVLKWRLLMNAAGAELAATDAVRCYYYGLFGNIFLPSIVGGDVVRAGLAARLSRSPGGVVLGSIVDRVLDTAGLAALAGIGALLLPAALDPRSRATFLAVVLTLAVAGLAAAALTIVLPRARRLPFTLRRRLATPRRALRELRRRPGILAAALLLGMGLQASLVFLNAWLGSLMGVGVSPVVWLFVWPLAKIAAIAPVTQGGVGVREGALVMLFRPFGVEAGAALATGLVFTTTVMAGGLCGGTLAWLIGRHRHGTDPQRPRGVPREAAAGES